ncbi:SfnB family sulfur acquisition oxidoreductase [Acinetobacter sp. VNH17]|uniref:SfnB family sulfur acquisition oxidoreductase n=1 Tax=Acinetobacter thutiue TaxID=2998078 RepID=A0ABT7WM25_9GAMM|nr:SfnB family sulfur acquisition oxidoreductase [Acinetobacter thutiue]MCY6411595.1 SfnB family sulfur acquisition oxidoreductase [Acinetobacter thutiue]MDN0013697.1 SfnB family sulfur acquisition oxidoreductase [Acinetobacter thutiue]
MGHLNIQQFVQTLPVQAAHRIQSGEEAINIAKQLATQFAQEASLRDQNRRLPVDELNAFSQSGLWSITIPKQYGGAGVSWRTALEVIKTISAVDPSLGQLPQNHLVILEHIRLDGTEQQKKFFFDLVLNGVRFGNAFSEIGNKHVADFKTILKPVNDNANQHGFEVNGKKFFATGALLAHWVPIVTVNDGGLPHLALVPRETAGLTIINDWSSFGQRTTASGTVIIEQVKVPVEHVIPIYQAFANPTVAGPVSQIIQAALDAGIARGAIEETIQYVRQYARPWIDANQDKATDDHYTIAAIGDLKIKLRAAEAVLDLAADQIEKASQEPSDDSVAEASVLVAEAKVLTTEIAILAANKLFELAGTRSTLAEHNLDRHWRNARTHTLHDPVRWKYHLVGNYFLNEIKPPRHPWA